MRAVVARGRRNPTRSLACSVALSVGCLFVCFCFFLFCLFVCLFFFFCAVETYACDFFLPPTSSARVALRFPIPMYCLPPPSLPPSLPPFPIVAIGQGNESSVRCDTRDFSRFRLLFSAYFFIPSHRASWPISSTSATHKHTCRSQPTHNAWRFPAFSLHFYFHSRAPL
jgi:hypothetical protein